MKYAKEVSEKISELPEMYYNGFSDFWCDNIDNVKEEDFGEYYLIKLENIKDVLLGTELANTI
jgi:hypothetical protein